MAEPAAAAEPVDLVGREAQVLEEFERLLETGRNQKSTPRRQLAHEEFEDRRLRSRHAPDRPGSC